MIVMFDVPSNTRTLILSAVYIEDGKAKTKRKIVRGDEIKDYTLNGEDGEGD